MTEPHAHPDRAAPTLAQRPAATGSTGPASTDAGRGDARADLQLLWFATERALAERGTEAARRWIDGYRTADLRAGTIQDGTARGLMARLEEAQSLCAPAAPASSFVDDADYESAPIVGKPLRRRREILIASAGTRVRFSRKGGIHVIDRERDLNLEDCLAFDDQPDAGCLDGFVPADGARPRLFSPGFLQPVALVQSKSLDQLTLTGRLGQRRVGFPCEIEVTGHKDESGIRVRIRIENRHRNHRLRVRFRGCPATGFVSSLGTPGFQFVEHPRGSFLAATLVRACGRLRVGENWVETPGAQLIGSIEHRFGLGIEV